MFGNRKRKTSPRIVDETPSEFNFAVQEYNQTVAPSCSNDDGLGPELPPTIPNLAPSLEGSVRAPLHVQVPNNNANRKSLGTIHEKDDTMACNLFQSASDEASHVQYMSSPSMQNEPSTAMPESAPTDTMYEEQYGDAYVGAPLKYVYPSGYQSMRPRSGPWKLSICVCLSFASLSVFTVRHCADQGENYQYGQIDDDQLKDELVIVTRWCNSRPLYFVWVISMMVTGLAAAYCCVIGYIKVRDFSVANCRSQPPGMVGKSDYYVQIRDVPPTDKAYEHYHKTIYQEDGTPQFWGTHIYRPTQAAVAVTSR